MITAQDIREKTFEKAKFGGYDMATVDDFLEELANDIAAAQKENALLKSKMKVLVDKVEEYRANEEAVNLAVLSAQKLAVQIENDARQRANTMLADAERQVKAIVGSIEDETAKQEKKLADAQAATTKFVEGIRAMCNAQLKNLDSILGGISGQGNAPKADSKTIDETVQSIEDSIARIQPEPSIKLDIDTKAPVKPARKMDSTQPFSL